MVTARIASNVAPDMGVDARAPGRGRVAAPGGIGRPEIPVRPGGRPQLRPIAAEDCLPYDPKALTIVDEGANGWLLADGGHRMFMLDDQDDAEAEAALAVARRHTASCFLRSRRG